MVQTGTFSESLGVMAKLASQGKIFPFGYQLEYIMSSDTQRKQISWTFIIHVIVTHCRITLINRICVFYNKYCARLLQCIESEW